MEDNSPICRYCNLMYTRLNEPIFIVCLCDNQAKFAHGSCFRNWQKYHKYGVCENCLTKTRIVQDGRKSLRETIIPPFGKKVVLLIVMTTVSLLALFAFLIWMLIEQCWQLHCIIIVSVISVVFFISLIMLRLSKESRKFWKSYSEQNHYWKVVYCFEEQNPNGKGMSRRYGDVPLTLPQNDQNNLSTSFHEYEVGINDFSGMIDTRKDFDFKQGERSAYPSVWAPRSYPYVKKNPVYDRDVVTSTKPKINEYVINGHLSSSSKGSESDPDLPQPVNVVSPYGLSQHSSKISVGSNNNYDEHYLLENQRSQRNNNERQQSKNRKLEQELVHHSCNPYMQNMEDYAGKIRSDSQVSRSRKTSKQSKIMYIDQRAESFYKRPDKNTEIQKYRELVRSHTYLPKQLMGGTPLFPKKAAALPRSSSEPDFRKSKPDLPLNRFSELFRRNHQANVKSKVKSKSSLDDSITGRFRLKNNTHADYKTSVMPHESDIEFKSSEPQPLVGVLNAYHQQRNKRISRDNRRNQSDYSKPVALESFPIQRSRSMYLPQDPFINNPNANGSNLNLVGSRPDASYIIPGLTPNNMHKSGSEPTVYLVRSNQSNELPAHFLERSISKIDGIKSSDKLKNALKNKSDAGVVMQEYHEKSNIIATVPVSNYRVSEQGAKKPSLRNDLEQSIAYTDERKNSKPEEKHQQRRVSSQNKEKRRNSENKKEKKSFKSNHENQRQNAENATDNENKKEIDRIMNTPLHKLDMNELFDQTKYLGKKRATILQQGMNMTSPFFAPTS